MGKFGKLAAAVGLSACFLAGCGAVMMPDTVDTPTLSIDKAGQIRLWLVGEFDKTYYELEELEEMAAEEARQYNMSKGVESAVSVEGARLLDSESGKVVLEYRFDGWESCTDFTKDEIFYGTVGEAVSRGFGMNVTMRSVKDNALFTEEQLRQSADRRLIIVGLAADIYCPGKVICVSEGAALNEDGSIASGETEGSLYILLQ